MLRKITVVVLLAVVFLAPRLPVLASERGPSTPEERARAVRIARDLEEHPLSSDTKEDMRWLTMFLIEVPDITVQWCTSLLSPIHDDESKYVPKISTQVLFSTAAFVIENPEKANDKLAVNTAAVEGALRTYESILRKKPKAHIALLDELLSKRDEGQLAAYVEEAMKDCE